MSRCQSRLISTESPQTEGLVVAGGGGEQEGCKGAGIRGGGSGLASITTSPSSVPISRRQHFSMAVTVGIGGFDATRGNTWVRAALNADSPQENQCCSVRASNLHPSLTANQRDLKKNSRIVPSDQFLK